MVDYSKTFEELLKLYGGAGESSTRDTYAESDESTVFEIMEDPEEYSIWDTTERFANSEVTSGGSTTSLTVSLVILGLFVAAGCCAVRIFKNRFQAARRLAEIAMGGHLGTTNNHQRPLPDYYGHDSEAARTPVVSENVDVENNYRIVTTQNYNNRGNMNVTHKGTSDIITSR